MMQRLAIPAVKRILCIGAHVDDIEIGCGGTLLRMLGEQPDVQVLWLIATSNPERRREALESARRFAPGTAQIQVKLWDFRDGFLPYMGPAIKEAFFEARSAFLPDLVFSHRLEDRHQDHRLLAELTWNTFREQIILEYEIPKYEGDLGQPNFFVQLSRETCEQKIANLLEGFPSQASKPWFEPESFWALLRLRGMEANADSKYAEAFTARKLCV